jgi:hypothetical protein
MKNFYFTAEGFDVVIEFTSHAQKRLIDRNVNEYGVYGAIVAVNDKILDLRNGDEFGIIDADLNIAIVCSVHSNLDEITISVVTVFDSIRFFFKKGTRVLSISSEMERRK